MTYQDVKTMMTSLATALKCDYAYSAFKSGTRSRFLIFYYEGNDDLFADGQNFQSIEQLTIEFYSPTKEINSEATIKTTLNSYGLAFSKTSAYINAEALNMTKYTMEAIISG